ncbi:hypothetical protein R1flu_026700 [Riccia fluitans]|uniref:UDP-N-acetylmuramate--L-alanine ligase n=1 Tax=Riccia fluitans TaxID=41844 RepID=A0ABD1XGP8_9MARC
MGISMDYQFSSHGATGVGGISSLAGRKASHAFRKFAFAEFDQQKSLLSGMKVACPSHIRVPPLNYPLDYGFGVHHLLEVEAWACVCWQNSRRRYRPRVKKIQVKSSDRRRSGYREVWSYSQRRNYIEIQASQAKLREDPIAKPSVHFIGIGGSGLSALALLALKQGWKVSGSDCTFNERLQLLKEAGASVYVGHAAEQLLDKSSSLPPDAVVVSSAIPTDNVEVEAAKVLGVPIYRRGDWIGRITDGYELLAIAGSHGKSSTTAMLATVLKNLGQDITAVVGADVPQFPDGANMICGHSRRFVLEADEYDGCFLNLAPSLAVVTTVDWEHVDIFPDEASVRKIFREFVQRMKPGGTLVLCGDSAGTKLLSTAFTSDEVGNNDAETTKSQYGRVSRKVVTYGLGNGNDWQAMLLTPNVQGGTSYVVVHSGRPMAMVSLQLPGTHYVLNSLAVIVVASLLATQDIESPSDEERFATMKKAAEAASGALGQFTGLRRRFEFVGKVKDCLIYDDYAHHPTEVRAVLQATRQRFDQQPIWVVFQPHTYSRLAKLLHDFAPAFSAADRVIVTEVYSAREDNTWNISGADLVEVITGPPAIFVPTLDEVVKRLAWELTVSEIVGSQGVILLTLGAGDITEVGYALLKEVSTYPVRQKADGTALISPSISLVTDNEVKP